MAKRFIVNDSNIIKIDEKHFEIFGDEVRHIQVLRYNVGEKIKINEYNCIIEKMTKSSIVLKKDSVLESRGVPRKNIILYIALLKNEKIDYVVQKAVELGVNLIVPFMSQNVIVKLDENAKEKRVLKFQKIANEACKQCGRTDIAKVQNIISFEKMLEYIKKHDISIFAYEKETSSLKEKLKDVEKSINNIACIIGPEGGFTENESKKISSTENVITIGLGERILRADTAAINVLSILTYEFDN